MSGVNGDARDRSVDRFRLTVKLLDDLHAGSGLGAVGIDALVQRDRLGRPVIRWSHFKGLLLEALYERGASLGVPKPTIEREVKRLFGARGDRGRGLAKGLSLRLADGNDSESTLVVASTARQTGTRMPKPETLRRVEYVRAGQCFGGEIRLKAAGDGAAATVRKLIERTHRLGGKRQRGAGHVHILLKHETIMPAPEPEPVQDEAGNRRVRVILRALEPLCLSAASGPGNLIGSRSHFSPAALRGVLAYWALECGWTRLADALLEQSVRCGAGIPVGPLTHAELADPGRIDAVPYPLSYQTPKPPAQSGELPWWADEAGRPTATDTLALVATKLKRPDPHDYLVTLDGRTWRRYRCPLRPELRNDAGYSQREKTKHQLYSLEQIPEDTCFAATLHLPNRHWPLVRAALEELSRKALWMQAGRGGAPLIVAGFADLGSDLGGASEPEERASRAAGGAGPAFGPATVRLFVETDLIVRRPDLSFCTHLDSDAVALLLSEIGCTQKPTEVKHVSEPSEIRGYNFATGQPRIPAIAIRRGSEALLRFESESAAAACAEMMSASGPAGVGERAAEGHGRVRVNFTPAEASVEVVTTGPVANRAEERLRIVQEELMNSGRGFPASFKAGRWQALRQAARDAGALEAWVVQATRELRKQSGGDPLNEATRAWFEGLTRERTRDPELVQLLGLHAARSVKRKAGR